MPAIYPLHSKRALFQLYVYPSGSSMDRWGRRCSKNLTIEYQTQYFQERIAYRIGCTRAL